jgi:hypothetical protein
MQPSLQAFEVVIEFHARVISNLGLTRVQYSVRRLCNDEKEKVAV